MLEDCTDVCSKAFIYKYFIDLYRIIYGRICGVLAIKLSSSKRSEQYANVLNWKQLGMKLHTSFAGRRAWRHIRAKAQAGEQREQLSIFRATQFHKWKPSHETLASKRLPHDGCAVCGPLVGSIRKHQIDDIKHMHAFAGDFKHRCGWFIDVLPLFQANTQKPVWDELRHEARSAFQAGWADYHSILRKILGFGCRFAPRRVRTERTWNNEGLSANWVQTANWFQICSNDGCNLYQLIPIILQSRGAYDSHKMSQHRHNQWLCPSKNLIPVLSFGEIQRKVWTALSPRDGNFLEAVLRDATSSLARVLMDLQHAAKTFWEQSFQGSSCFKYVQVITNDPRRGQFH